MKYKKKPVVIEAIQFKGNENLDEILKFIKATNNARGEFAFITGKLIIPTLEGNMEANPGDWIIKGIKGEFYPIKNEIFLLTYEAVEDAT